MKIYDVTGKQVYSNMIDLNRGSIKQVHVNLKSGLYFLNFASEKLKSSQKIIIK